MKEKETITENKKIVEAREKREIELQGKKGKGEKFNRYKLFCLRCHCEYMITDITECYHCKGPLMTPEVRTF